MELSGTLHNRRRSKWAGMTLTELMVALVVAAILILGVYSTTALPMARIVTQTLQDESLAGDIDAAFTNLGNLATPGMATGARLFVIYASGGGAVTDGTAGVKLHVPYVNAANDVEIFLQNGALVSTQNGKTTTIVPSGVTSVSFTAVVSGNPGVRTGAVLCSLNFLNKGNTYTYSTTVWPRNQ
jgi:prepilin-type N-terminal cleavage/methylation domain-containing protein